MSHVSGLRVRQHKRSDIDLPVEFVVAERDRPQVRFSASSPAESESVIRGISIDISPGGMGFNSEVYLPRGCEGSLRVLDPLPTGQRPDGTTLYEVFFSQRVKVRRVRMIEGGAFFIGVSFAEPEQVDPDITNRMMLLKRHFDESQARPGSPDG